MVASRIEIFKQILAEDPTNASVLFGLAKEYEKASDHANLIEVLERYLLAADDEGNAYGMLARAYERTGQPDKARATYQRGIEASMAHGHPGMAEEYRTSLEEQ